MHNISSESFFEFAETIRGIMKIRNGFMQGRSIIVGQIFLELSEGFCRGIKIVSISALLQADGMLNKSVYTPYALFRISIIRKSVFGVNHCHSFTFSVATTFFNDIFQIRSNVADIFHQCFWIGKNICVDPLQDKTFGF